MNPDEDEVAKNVERILQSPSYRLAYKDIDFLSDPRLRPVRMQLELLKPEMAFEGEKIASTIVVFGGTRILPRPEAEKKLQAARALLAEQPGDSRREREVARAERLLAKSHYY
ncbi:MAG: 3-isopropylmalate dehydrogenase, partial [Thermoguttaceae bacterium]